MRDTDNGVREMKKQPGEATDLDVIHESKTHIIPRMHATAASNVWWLHGRVVKALSIIFGQERTGKSLARELRPRSAVPVG